MKKCLNIKLYLIFGLSNMPNRPLSAEAVSRFHPMRIPDVMKVTETSVRLQDSLQDYYM